MAAFTVEQPNGRGPVIAYIDGDGDLVVRASPGANTDAFAIFGSFDRAERPGVQCAWSPDRESVQRRFYVGDSVTITF